MSKESWNEYQNNYRKKHYAQVSAYLDPSLVDALKKKLKKERTTFSSFLREKITEYLEK